MMQSLFTAASGMAAQQLNLDNISNNLANVNTTAFKGTRLEFQDLLYKTYKAPGTPQPDSEASPTGIQVGMGVKPSATLRDFSTGSFIQTDNPFDVAIQGDGFFKVMLPDGSIAYSRDGSFRPDFEGRLVSSDGYFLEPQVTVPRDTISTSVSITPDGRINVSVSTLPNTQLIGQLQLARFINPAGLSAIGKNLFVPTDASGPAIDGNPGTNDLGVIQQKFLEGSNVQVVDEMVGMIITQRSYELNSKAVQASDVMLSQANNLLSLTI